MLQFDREEEAPAIKITAEDPWPPGANMLSASFPLDSEAANVFYQAYLKMENTEVVLGSGGRDIFVLSFRHKADGHIEALVYDGVSNHTSVDVKAEVFEAVMEEMAEHFGLVAVQ